MMMMTDSDVANASAAATTSGLGRKRMKGLQDEASNGHTNGYSPHVQQDIVHLEAAAYAAQKANLLTIEIVDSIINCIKNNREDTKK